MVGKILLGIVVGYLLLCAIAALAMAGWGSALVFALGGLLTVGLAVQRGVIGERRPVGRSNTRFFLLPLNLPIAVGMLIWWAARGLWRASVAIYHAIVWLAQISIDLVRRHQPQTPVRRAGQRPNWDNVVQLRRR